MALPPQLRWLLESHFDSIEKIEIVAYLRRINAPAARDMVRTALPVPTDMFDEAIADLLRGGFVDLAEDGLRLGPRAELDSRFGPLLEVYEHDRPAVMSELSTLALRRIRENATRMFGKKDGNE